MFEQVSTLKEVNVTYSADTIPHHKFVDPWARLELHEPKVVAIDFDETISDNPSAWLMVMKTLEMCGYHVVVCTWRYPHTHPEDLQFLVDKGYSIFYTGLRAKRPFMEALGIYVNIWIDDNPWAIENDAEDRWIEDKKLN